MQIIFGLALDYAAAPDPSSTQGGLLYAGPKTLIQWLENYCGLGGHETNIEHLRIAQYRLVVQQFLAETDREPFFAPSFRADQLATSADLLNRRDELKMAGWSPDVPPDSPPRLSVLAGLETLLATDDHLKLTPGLADRFGQLLEALPQRNWTIEKIQLLEPLSQLPPYIVRLMNALAENGIPVLAPPAWAAFSDLTDLGRWQKNLAGWTQTREQNAQNDGSLLVIRGKRDTDLATFVAALIRKNPSFSPLLLVPDQSRTIDNALVQQGLPSPGIPSHSMARPSLQILKLATAFLWEPLDPYKVLEFVSLALKPLQDDLARRIGQHIAQRPGVQGEDWQSMIGQFLAEWSDKPTAERDHAMQQFRFWFERNRYDHQDVAPTAEAISIYRYIQSWAFEKLESAPENNTLMVLAEQSRQMVELLSAWPEDALSALELERIVRTIYESVPVQFTPRQANALPVVYHPHALLETVEDLCWWNFVEYEPDYFFSRWYSDELSWLQEHGILLDTPARTNERQTFLRKQALLKTQNRVLLLLPDVAEGQEVTPHPLFADLQAYFRNWPDLTLSLDDPELNDRLKPFFAVDPPITLPHRPLSRPQPFITLPTDWQMDARPHETLTSLEALFYYPYQWLFRHKAQLRKSAILSIVPEKTLLGNLAHRFFEQLFEQPGVTDWTREQVVDWIAQTGPDLLSREGAILLLYGREPLRVQFLKQIEYAAWNLLSFIQANGWSVMGTEVPLNGTFEGMPVKGRADLVLQKGNEWAIIDLKWRGGARRRALIRNREDIQLVLYARLISEEQRWVHTAYYILSTGELIARTAEAFPQIQAVEPEADARAVNQDILERMTATYQWRMGQLNRGLVEVRCSETAAQLQAAYAEEDLLSLLEMRQEDAPFDDYQVLIGKAH